MSILLCLLLTVSPHLSYSVQRAPEHHTPEKSLMRRAQNGAKKLLMRRFQNQEEEHRGVVVGIQTDGESGKLKLMRHQEPGAKSQEPTAPAPCAPNPFYPSCPANEPCQRLNGVLSANRCQTFSTMINATLDETGEPRWCGSTEGDLHATKAACESHFTFMNCQLTHGMRTVYYPCQWSDVGIVKRGWRRHCFASQAFTAPQGVLLADGSFHPEVCNCASDCAEGNLQGVAGDALAPGETCISPETFDATNRWGPNRCV